MKTSNTTSRLRRVKSCLFAAAVCAFIIGASAHQAQLAGSASGAPVGLSLFFRDGAAAPITLVGDAPRYLQEIDIVATVATQGDQGIGPLIENSELASLDWSGVNMVEEDWRAAGDGTFIRQRFYRNARWMEKPSLFLVTATDDRGRPVGPPVVANAGKDDMLKSSDDGFVRRFVVRQVAFGCPSQSDCAGATFMVQGLVQLRDALNPEQSARTISTSQSPTPLQTCT